MNKKTAHVISHTHWDREWYMPYEYHHKLLIELMDTLLETLEKDPEYRSFHLDGQTIMLEDYLQIRPEKKEELKRYIQEGRIHIGPWYILQDEFLTSSEANVRNLQIGHKDAREYGNISKLGYFPDSFGNMGQAPQMLKQAGIDVAVFGRGVKPTGFNNMVSEEAGYESPFSEMVWQSPDGSEVLGVLFANWYCNGMEVPVDPEEAKIYWDKALSSAEKFASTGQLLFMNGCDHQPIQTDLSAALTTARELYPDVDFVHASFDEYVEALQKELPERLQKVHGELRSQRTDGWYTLVNTASSRVYLKQMNAKVQNLLEQVAEPLSTAAYLTGKTYPHHLLEYAWKTLMQNHPHDSICGCSVDEVHREMVTRFEKAQHMTEAIIDDALSGIAGEIDTTKLGSEQETVEISGDVPSRIPFTVFNGTGDERSGVVEITLQLNRRYFSENYPNVLARELREQPIPAGRLVSEDGSEIICTIEDAGVQFGYDLPKDRFRQPYVSRCIKLTFEAEQVPAVGYRSFAFVPNNSVLSLTDAATPVILGADAKVSSDDLSITARSMENEYVRLNIAEDGSIELTNKKTGQVQTGLAVIEDSGDIGNEYMFKKPNGEVPLTTKGSQASIRIVEETPYRVAMEIVHDMQIPASADELLEQEMTGLVGFPARKAGRSDVKVSLPVTLRVSLEKSSRRVDVDATILNQAKDHRVRVLFPTDFTATSHQAESIFECAERPNIPAPEWENPSNDQHMQSYVSMSDGTQGLTIIGNGLNEYEILNERNTIAVTVLRSVGELGDWGVFPTPEAQCLGEQKASFSIVIHEGDVITSGAYKEVTSRNTPWFTKQLPVQEGTLPATHSFLSWNGTGMAFSSLKVSQVSGDVVSRWVNLTGEQQELSLESLTKGTDAYRSNLLEEQLEKVAFLNDNNGLSLPVQKAEIVSIGWKPAKV
ncbi:alpha-mannosidase [Paenibacillus sp. Marseille-Q4541]|uniref:alpha-mannosidase n=1 Tax=Paenibacillus sp. Marseille-Q4541 TaxID=2831522 RepID=UPI001BA43F1B|nr:alpha-mannosidase [Paenibacillus sp. Marseille-Q4541]